VSAETRQLKQIATRVSTVSICGQRAKSKRLNAKGAKVSQRSQRKIWRSWPVRRATGGCDL